MIHASFAVILALLANICFCQYPEVSQQDIENNQATWQAAGILNYDMIFQWNIFSIYCFVVPKLISVRNGVITSVSYANPDDPQLPDEYPNCGLEIDSYETIDGLFNILLDAKTGDFRANSTTAEFDDTYGYPVNAWIDYLARAADDERGWSITLFETVSPVEICEILTCNWKCDTLYQQSPYGCSCDDDMNKETCRDGLCHTQVGCSQCINNHWKLDYSYYCVSCQESTGEHCMHCSDFNGCQQCQDGYTRVFDDGCGFWYCQEDFCDGGSTKEKVNSPAIPVLPEVPIDPPQSPQP